jgi:diguanylate cyclase (GGDEF)-like protein/PAS domain S-box-containing protein
MTEDGALGSREKVLIVDDTPDNLRLLSDTLTGYGYDVQCAISGALALTGVKANPPDIILLDIKMPQMDGYEVCQQLKGDRATRDIPIIFLSALDEAFDKVRAFQIGGIDYITKPFQVEEVIARIENHLALQRARAEILTLNRELEERVTARTQALAQANTALEASEERFRLVANAAPVLIWMADAQGQRNFVNQRWLEFTGYTLEQSLGTAWLEGIHPGDRSHYQQIYQTAFAQRQRFTVEYRLQNADQAYRWILSTGVPLLGSDGTLAGFIGSGIDIHDRKQAEDQLMHNALHDRLTDLPNRALLMERLELSLNRASRHAHSRFAVLFLDLDRFKLINDSLGHLAGDQLLIAIAARLATIIRPTDLLARLGGDEFVLLLEDIEGIQEAVQVATRILEQMRSPFAISGREVFMTASIGIVFNSPSYREGAELLRDADTAMYQAKTLGKSRYAIFDPLMHQAALEQLHLESDLRKALKHQQFVLYYQPIIDLATETLSGFEALIRWQHPERGLLSPAQFIPQAEETGLIIALGQWVLQEACRQTQQWQTRFNQMLIKVSVNLSVKQLKEPNFLEQVDQVLATTGLPGQNLTLEITESMLIDGVEAAIRLLEQLRSRAIQIDIDDFGTGYSSLSYLHQFPIHALKVDRAFTQGIDQNADIVRAIIALGQALELAVIAEGIETPTQLSILKALGCRYGQGYYLGTPRSAPEFEQLLASFFIAP